MGSGSELWQLCQMLTMAGSQRLKPGAKKSSNYQHLLSPAAVLLPAVRGLRRTCGRESYTCESQGLGLPTAPIWQCPHPASPPRLHRGGHQQAPASLDTDVQHWEECWWHLTSLCPSPRMDAGVGGHRSSLAVQEESDVKPAWHLLLWGLGTVVRSAGTATHLAAGLFPAWHLRSSFPWMFAGPKIWAHPVRGQLNITSHWNKVTIYRAHWIKHVFSRKGPQDGSVVVIGRLRTH